MMKNKTTRIQKDPPLRKKKKRNHSQTDNVIIYDVENSHPTD